MCARACAHTHLQADVNARCPTLIIMSCHTSVFPSACITFLWKPLQHVTITACTSTKQAFYKLEEGKEGRKGALQFQSAGRCGKANHLLEILPSFRHRFCGRCLGKMQRRLSKSSLVQNMCEWKMAASWAWRKSGETLLHANRMGAGEKKSHKSSGETQVEPWVPNIISAMIIRHHCNLSGCKGVFEHLTSVLTWHTSSVLAFDS